jgi:hypothetical protein
MGSENYTVTVDNWRTDVEIAFKEAITMPENKNLVQVIRLRIRDLFVGPPRTNLLSAIDLVEEMIYRKTRITHLLFLSVIPISILVIFIILPLLDKSPSISTDSDGLIIALHIGSISSILGGALVPKIYGSRYEPDSFKAINRIFMYHVNQLIAFVVPVLLGYYCWNSGGRWFLILPFFIFSAIALILTFPTRKNWERWRFG